ncbi:MAG: PorP/SprF family type IX secretion system membrane protein [Cytophagales bacterium]
MKYFYSTLLFLLIVSQSNAQQVQDYNLYSKNLFLINPAFAGYSEGASIFLQARSAFRGVDNAPRNFTVGFSAPIERFSLGTGAKINIDQRGIFQTFSADIAAAYKLIYKYKHVFSFGMDIGFVNRSYNLNGLNGKVDMADPTLTSDYFNKTYFKSGVGVSYISPNAEVGIAFPMLIESEQEINTNLNAYAGYKFSASDAILLKPSGYFRTVANGSVQGDINFMAEWKKMIWVQPGFRSNMTFLLSAGFGFPYGSIGYSFNYYSGAYKNVDLNAHEFFLVLNLGGNNGKAAFTGDRKAGQQLPKKKRN